MSSNTPLYAAIGAGVVLIGAILLWPSGEPEPTPTSPDATPTAQAQPSATPVAQVQLSTASVALRRVNPSIQGLQRAGVFRGGVERNMLPPETARLIREQKERERLAVQQAQSAPVGEASLRRYGVTASGIRGAVQDKLPELRACYEPWAAANPKLGGKIDVNFTIRAEDAPDGSKLGARVRQVKLAGGRLGNVALEGCILNVFGGLEFERPEGGEIKVNYPLSFSSDGEPAKR
jgi:hypothetical protein